MKITLGLNEEDIRTIRELRIIADLNCKEYEDKEEIDWHDNSEFKKWASRYELFNRLEVLIDNQVAMDTSINMNAQKHNEESPIWLC